MYINFTATPLMLELLRYNNIIANNTKIQKLAIPTSILISYFQPIAIQHVLGGGGGGGGGGGLATIVYSIPVLPRSHAVGLLVIYPKR